MNSGFATLGDAQFKLTGGTLMVRIVLLAACLTATASFASAGEMSPPNVLVIVVDDLGYGELACLRQGEHRATSPRPTWTPWPVAACSLPPAT